MQVVSGDHAYDAPEQVELKQTGPEADNDLWLVENHVHKLEEVYGIRDAAALIRMMRTVPPTVDIEYPNYVEWVAAFLAAQRAGQDPKICFLPASRRTAFMVGDTNHWIGYKIYRDIRTLSVADDTFLMQMDVFAEELGCTLNDLLTLAWITPYTEQEAPDMIEALNHPDSDPVADVVFMEETPERAVVEITAFGPRPGKSPAA